MASYNRLTTEMQCPLCHSRVEVVTDCYFGYSSEMKDYRVGESYEWLPRKAAQNGGRPEGGNIHGAGYTECPQREKDYYVKVIAKMT